MADDWLDELYRLHNEDKAKRQQIKADALHEQLDLNALSKNRLDLAAAVLRSVNAHQVLRRAQEALLGGKGVIDIFDFKENYDRVIELVWQGPISAAQRPTPADIQDCYYIAIGARDNKLFVNGKEIKPITPEALKAALVEAAKNPGRVKPSKNPQ